MYSDEMIDTVYMQKLPFLAFIPFREDMPERETEQALVQDITKLLLEAGIGFAFSGISTI